MDSATQVVVDVNDEKPHYESVDQAISTYIDLRNELAEERKAFEAIEKNLKLKMEKTQMWLRDVADKLGVDSLASRDSGTAFRCVKTSYRVENFDEFIAWIKENNYFHCLEKRCAKNAVAEIHNATAQLPPGLYYETEVTMDVRKPTKSSKK
jgi:hypothetical protein